MNNKIDVQNFNFFYSSFHALKGLTIPIRERQITALIGPSGCGKSTFLRSLNRMNDTIAGTRATGEVLLDGKNIYAPEVDVTDLRSQVGMVFQRPNPFPQSIYDNVAFGPRVTSNASGKALDAIVQESLEGAGLWGEIKHRLRDSALSLNPGQQQRLCIARAIAAEPEVLLLDEPCSALDPIATGKVEDLIQELRGRYSVLMVTHNMQQASRTSDYTAFMYLGRLIEYGATTDIFTKPVLRETEAYVTGRFG